MTGLSGASKAIEVTNKRISQYAASDSEVLIQGETGVGKSRCARLIHDLSNRNRGPFVELNCGSIPRGLVESELFGHEKGAFTGAIKTHAGYIRRAQHGTLFLDEIGDMPLEVQAHLLHFLESKRIHSVGSDRDDLIDCRIIAATNESVETLIEQGEFRKDLFYRLNVLPITIPSLRERREDILLLADEFLQFEIESLNIDNRTFSSNCYTVLRHYSWPGNIRELKNVIKRAVVLSHGQSIEPESLGIEVDTLFTVKDHKEMRSEMLEQVIRSHKFNMTAVARTLNISRPTLYRLIKKHNIQLDS
ncbi:sigma-54 interaction domain-containing protein [Vibrio mediterranei]|uniref:Sigma-54-dependent Fis family transcriptional regulator n=1 Tax=Vibrio mediterranei TaxID=689 RepID=A0AAN1FLR4_9VIBR|nr:sigma-54 dependent transcriptional regulator [Vibrio mediterranei]ASI92928.1 sigma-54-dependent Fis family transcriptional regulator [Vibrio mediterranei]